MAGSSSTEHAPTVRRTRRHPGDALPVAHLTLGAKTRILIVNNKGADLLGDTPENLVGRSIEEFIAPEWLPVFRDTFAEPSEASCEIGLLGRGGKLLSIQMEVGPLSSDAVRHVVLIDIRAWRQSVQRFNDIANATREWVWEVDALGKYIYSSDAVFDFLGYRADEVLGRSAFALMPLEEGHRIQRIFQRIALRREPFVDLPNTLLHRDGSVRHVLTTGVPVFDADGRFTGYRGTDRDVTDRRQIEQKLKLLSLAVEQNPAAIIITDTNHRIEYVNQTFTEMMGYSALEVLGQPTRILSSGETPTATFGELNVALQQGETWHGKFINRHRSGRKIVNFAHITPIQSGSGEVMHYLSIQEDVTEAERMSYELDLHRRHLESLVSQRTAELEETKRSAEQSANLLQEAIDCVPHGFTIYDREERLLMCNRAHAEFYGSCRDVLVPGTHILTTLRAAADRGLVREAIGREDQWIWERLRQFHSECGKPCEQQLADGRWLLASETRTPSGYIVGNRTDITELKAVQERLTEARDAANASSQAKSLFLANMSHEIRTPMNAIIGLTHLCLQTPLSDKQRDYLEKTHDAATLLLGILNDILDFSKIEAGKLTIEHIPFSLEETVSSVVSLFTSVAQKKGLLFDLSIAANTPSNLAGDPLRIRQVLSNLISNAIKFTNKGSVSVDIRADAHPQDARQVLFHFAVSDTGIGIQKQQLEQLFQVFAQADSSITRKYGGTGLGLSICKELVVLMGGNLTVESSLNAGSCFRFSLPLSLDDSDLPQPHGIDNHHVLIMEDDKIHRVILKRIFEDFGFKATVVESGEEALTVCATTEGFDLVLTDLRLPGIDGFEATRQIQSRFPQRNIPVIMITGADFDQIQSLHREGITRFVFKPVKRSTLFDTVQEIFRGTISGHPSSRETAQPSDADLPPHFLRGTRILLVEDNEFNQQVGLELLENRGAVVDIAGDGQEALQRVERQAYDIILMDIQMPVMDGLSATMAMRALPAVETIPIIAMTANVLIEEQARCLAAGMNDFLPKPVVPDQLYRVIARWLPVSNPAAETEMPCAAPTEKLIDVESGLFFSGGRHDVYRKLLTHFLANHAGDGTRLLEAWKNGERERSHRLAHSLKGIAATLGAEPLAQAARDLDAAFKADESTERIAALIDRLDDMVIQTTTFAHTIINENLGQAGEAESLPRLPDTT